MHMRAVHPDMDTHITCKRIDPAPMEEALEGLARIRAQFEADGETVGPPTPSKDERHFDDVLYWLRKVRDRVSDVGKEYFKIDDPHSVVTGALLDAENAVEDCIYEYRQAWELAKGHEAEAYCEDNYNGLPGGPADR